MLDAAPDNVRVSLTLPAPLYNKLRSTADRLGVSLAYLVRESLELNTLLLNEEASDAKVLIEHADGRVERVVRR